MVVDGKEAPFTYDNTWGTYWYVKIDGQWYKHDFGSIRKGDGLEPDNVWYKKFTTTPPESARGGGEDEGR